MNYIDELQVVGKAASIAIQTWVRNNDKTKARAEERETNFTRGAPVLVPVRASPERVASSLQPTRAS